MFALFGLLGCQEEGTVQMLAAVQPHLAQFADRKMVEPDYFLLLDLLQYSTPDCLVWL